MPEFWFVINLVAGTKKEIVFTFTSLMLIMNAGKFLTLWFLARESTTSESGREQIHIKLGLGASSVSQGKEPLLRLTPWRSHTQTTHLGSRSSESAPARFCLTRCLMDWKMGQSPTHSTAWCSRTSIWKSPHICRKLLTSMGWVNLLDLTACDSQRAELTHSGLRTSEAGTSKSLSTALILSSWTCGKVDTLTDCCSSTAMEWMCSTSEISSHSKQSVVSLISTSLRVLLR